MQNQFRIALLIFVLGFSSINALAEDATSYLQSAIRKHKRHQITEALLDYDKAIALEPDSGDLYYNRGLARQEGGDYNGAIDDFNRALEFDPQNDSAYFNRGISKFELKNYRSALKDFNQTILMVPGDAKALFNRAITKNALGDTNGALHDAYEARRLFKVMRKQAAYQEVNDFISFVKNPTPPPLEFSENEFSPDEF